MKPVKILLLDDESVIRRIISNVLKKKGFIVKGADKIIDAKKLLETENFDIVLCDIFLGEEESGLDFLKYSKKNNEDIGFIMITGSSDQRISEEAIKTGVHGYLLKPFDENQLLITIENCLQRLELEKNVRTHVKNLDKLVNEKTKDLSEKINELEETKKKLQKSEATFRSIFENMQEGFYRTDKDGRVILINPAASEITGYDKKEIIGLHISSLYQIPEHRETILNELYKKGALSNIETILKRKDGSLITVLAASNVLYDENGEISGIEGVFHDISKRVALEVQIAESRKLRAIGKLAAGIAHEINTPTQYVGDNTLFLKDSFNDLITVFGKINSVISNKDYQNEANSKIIAELMEIKDEGDIDFLIEEIPKAIDQNLDGIDRVTKIVQSMKKFSHPNEDKVQININSAITDTVTVSKHEWKYVADVVTEFEEDIPNVMCFAGELNQVLLNIIVNASHAIADVVEGTEQKGIIKIQTSKKEESVVIKIEDTGNGISEEYRKSIFDPFFTTKGIGKGTGQGLAIAKSVVVEKHGGKLFFDTVMGKGTTFTIELPVG